MCNMVMVFSLLGLDVVAGGGMWLAVGCGWRWDATVGRCLSGCSMTGSWPKSRKAAGSVAPSGFEDGS
jgi:hypothetical protein